MSSSHAHSGPEKNIKTAFFLNLTFTIFEFVGGFYLNSLAIMADAVHDLGDTVSLGLSWFLNKSSQKEKTKTFSYGFKRLSVLSAFINCLVLITGSLYILSEAIPRLLKPEHFNAKGMLIFALFGILFNGLAAYRLKKGTRIDEKVVSWHLFEDVLGWFAVLIVSIISLVKDIHFLDPLLSILIAVYVLFNVVKNLKQAVSIFLEGTPGAVNLPAVESEICKIPRVQAVHDTHLWTLDGENHILTTHLILEKGTSNDNVVKIKCQVKKLLSEQSINHSTLEVEEEDEACAVTD